MARMSGRQFDRNLLRQFRRRFGRPLDADGSAPAATPDRMAEIAELAAAVADEHCPQGPVQPRRIAAAKAVTISFGRYGDAFDGMLEHRSGRFHIYANLQRLLREDSPRSRFTLGHELGHYYIDEHRSALAAGAAPAHRSSSEYESRLIPEQEADCFAANLLMPTDRFLRRAKGLPPGLAGVLELADHFGTSVTATAIRYAESDVRPCAVVKWDRSGYAWKHLSASTYRAFFRTTFESPADLPEDGPTRRALARAPLPEHGYFQAGTTASAWFPRVEPGQWRDVIFIEQAVSLGRFGALTFLYPADGGYQLPA
jgi:hypothetical protein